MENVRTTALSLSLMGLWLMSASCAAGPRRPFASPAPQPARAGPEAPGGSGVPDSRAAKSSDRAVPLEEIPIVVTDHGFEPSNITIVRNRPVTLSFVLATSKACRRDVLIRVSPWVVLRQRLVLHQAVSMTVSFPETGTMGFTCDGSKKSGTITIKDER